MCYFEITTTYKSSVHTLPADRAYVTLYVALFYKSHKIVKWLRLPVTVTKKNTILHCVLGQKAFRVHLQSEATALKMVGMKVFVLFISLVAPVQ